MDILVNNAGIVTGTKFLDTPDKMNVKTMDVNCNAHFWVRVLAINARFRVGIFATNARFWVRILATNALKF